MDFDKRNFSNFPKDGNLDEKVSRSRILMTGKEILNLVRVTSASGGSDHGRPAGTWQILQGNLPFGHLDY